MGTSEASNFINAASAVNFMLSETAMGPTTEASSNVTGCFEMAKLFHFYSERKKN